jgi:hypothetical protein
MLAIHFVPCDDNDHITKNMQTNVSAKKTGAMRQRAFEHTKGPEVHRWTHHV